MNAIIATGEYLMNLPLLIQLVVVVGTVEAVTGAVKIYKEVDKNGDWCPECNRKLHKVELDNDKVISLHQDMYKCSNKKCETHFVEKEERGQKDNVLQFEKVA